MLLLRLIVLVSVYWYHFGRGQHPNTEIYQRYCPNTKLCGSATNHTRHNDTSVPVVHTPCCSPCYCDSQCRTFSDCCPDALGEGKTENVHSNHSKRVCMFATYLPANVIDPIVDVSRRYLMVDSCPDYYNGSLIKKCLGDFEETPTFEDIAVVSDSHRLSRVYKNKHCALCNGVDEIKRWELSTTYCVNTTDSQLHNIQLADVESFLINHCVIESRPMADMQGHTIRCSGRVDECAGDVNNTDPNIVKACSTSFTPTIFRHYSSLQPQIFQNIYCYVCNRNDETETALCRDGLYNIDSRGSSFIAVLDLKSAILPAEKESKYPEKCNPGTIYDKIFGHCRPFKCGWYTGVYGNKCRTFAEVVPGCYLYMYVVFNFDSPTTLSTWNIMQADVKAIEHDISQQAYFHTCAPEVAYIYGQLDKLTHRVMYLKIVLKKLTNANCTNEFLFDHYWKSFRKPWRQTIRISNQSLPSTGRISFYKVYEKGSDLTMLYVGHIGSRRRRCIHTFTMFLCPYFILNVSEYKKVMENTLGTCDECPGTNMSITTSLYDGFYPVARDEIAVCTETYGELTNQAVSTSRYKWQENCFISIILITSRMVGNEH